MQVWFVDEIKLMFAQYFQLATWATCFTLYQVFSIRPTKPRMQEANKAGNKQEAKQTRSKHKQARSKHKQARSKHELVLNHEPCTPGASGRDAGVLFAARTWLGRGALISRATQVFLGQHASTQCISQLLPAQWGSVPWQHADDPLCFAVGYGNGREVGCATDGPCLGIHSRHVCELSCCRPW